MDTVRIGIIGVGNMGQNHARVAADTKGVEFAGVFDVSEAAARTAADRFGVRTFADVADLLDACDGVVIATPSVTHTAYARQAIAAGKAALVEKPVASDLADAEELAKLAEDAGALVCVGHIERFNPAFQELARRVAGRRVRALEFRRVSPHTPQSEDVDVTLDLMIHDIDLMFALTGQTSAEVVSAVGQSVHGGLADITSALLRLPDGTAVTLLASKASFEKVRSIAVHADDATLSADLLTREIDVSSSMAAAFRDEKTGRVYQQNTAQERVFAAPIEPLRAEMRSFVNAIAGAAPAEVTVQDGVRALRTAIQVAAAAS